MKMDPGTWTLNGANTYDGATQILAGTLVVGNGSALGTTAAGTTVAGGATLDVNGQSLGSEHIVVEDGGAVVNRGGANYDTLHSVAFTGDAIFGGTERFDVRTSSALDAAGFALTKVDGNYVALAGIGETHLGDINITGGTPLDRKQHDPRRRSGKRHGNWRCSGLVELFKRRIRRHWCLTAASLGQRPLRPARATAMTAP